MHLHHFLIPILVVSFSVFVLFGIPFLLRHLYLSKLVAVENKNDGIVAVYANGKRFYQPSVLWCYRSGRAVLLPLQVIIDSDVRALKAKVKIETLFPES